MLRASDQSFFPPPYYDELTPHVTIRFHHSGEFVDDPYASYIGGKMVVYDHVDINEIGKDMLDKLTNDVGMAGMKKYFRIVDNEFKLFVTDREVMQCCLASRYSREVNIYVDGVIDVGREMINLNVLSSQAGSSSVVNVQQTPITSQFEEPADVDYVDVEETEDVEFVEDHEDVKYVEEHEDGDFVADTELEDVEVQNNIGIEAVVQDLGVVNVSTADRTDNEDSEEMSSEEDSDDSSWEMGEDDITPSEDDVKSIHSGSDLEPEPETVEEVFRDDNSFC